MGFNDPSTTLSDSVAMSSDIHDGVNAPPVILYEELSSQDLREGGIQNEVASISEDVKKQNDGVSLWEEGDTSEIIQIDIKNVLELKGVDVVEIESQAGDIVGEILSMLLNDVHWMVQLRNLGKNQ